MTNKPVLTDKVLEKLVELAHVNERFSKMEENSPKDFYIWGEESQRRYEADTKPILQPFAKHYAPVKREMELREAIYQDQMCSPS